MASSRHATTNPSRWTNPGGAGGFNTDRVNTCGTGGDYSALSTWEGDTDVDITDPDGSPISGTPCCPVVEVLNDLSFTGGTFSGATTSTTYFRVIRAASSVRHGGTATAGATLSNSGSTNTTVITAGENYLALQDLKFSLSSNTGTACNAVAVGNVVGRFVGLLVKAVNAGGVANGINVSASQAHNAFNNVVYECDDDGIIGRGSTCLVYNNTVVGCGGVGFNYATNACVWKNNIAQSNTTDYNGNGATGTTHNLASDTTAPETGTYWDSKTITFVDAANDDYRLTNDADAVGMGTDLSATFDDDIAYTVRS